MKDQISSGEDTQGLVPAPWEMFENALDRKERRGKSFIWYSIAAGVLLVFSAVIAWFGVADKSVKDSQPVAATASAPVAVEQEKAPDQTGSTLVDKAAVPQENAIENVAPEQVVVEPSNRGVQQGDKKQAGLRKSKTETSASATNPTIETPVAQTITPQTQIAAPQTQTVAPQNQIAAPQNSNTRIDRKTAESTSPVSEILVSTPVSENRMLNNSGMAWMLDAAGFELQAVELSSDFAIAQLDLAKLNREFESSELSKGSLSDLAYAMDLDKWWIEVSADQNQTGLTYRTANDLSQYVHKNYTEQMRNGETALSAARFQLAVNMFIAKNSSVKVGLAYAQNKVGQNFNFRDSMPAVVSAGQTPDAYGNYPIFGYLGLGPEVKYNGVVNYSYLSLPIGWTGYFPIGQSKNLFFAPEAVLQPNWVQLSTGAQTLDYQTLLLKPMDAVNYRAYVMSARVAAGIQKRLNYRHAVGAKLNAQGVLNSMNTANSPVQTRGWSSGLTLYYLFKID